MRILLSNDMLSGQAMRVLAGILTIWPKSRFVAPDRNQSGVSNPLTLDRAFGRAGRRQRLLRDGTPRTACTFAITGLSTPKRQVSPHQITGRLAR